MRHFHISGFSTSGVIFCAFFTIAAMAWAGTYSGGAGTVANPYKITLPGDWLELVGASGDWGKQFVLTKDLDMAGIAMTPVAPYGTNKTTFSGTIDGRNHSIRNVTINRPNISYVGLIGNADNRCAIQNLRLDNIQITGGDRVGGLAGQSAAILNNCHVTGSVSGTGYVGGLVGWYSGNLLQPFPTAYGLINYCNAAVTVTGTSEVGGLVGHAIGVKITSCYASGNVSGSSSVGGLLGYTQSSNLIHCYATGATRGNSNVGGLIGFHGSSAWGCYSTGKVIGDGSNIGGLIGQDFSGYDLSCFWDTETSGQVNSAGGVGKTTVEMKSRSTYPIDEWDFIGTGDMWGDWLMPEDGYPKLAWEEYPLVTIPDMKGMTESEARTRMADLGIVAGDSYETFEATLPIGQVSLTRPLIGTSVYSGFTKVDLFLARDRRFSGGSGTAEDPYRIANPGDWKDLMGNNTDWDKHFLVTSDMDLAKINLLRVGTANVPFTGQLEGAGHIFRNVTLDRLEADLGLFGSVGISGQVRNLELDNLFLNANYYLGGLAAHNSGTIVSCIVTGTILGSDYIGGLVGENSGTISHCQSTCKVNSSPGACNYTGGLVGYNNKGSILNSFAEGKTYGYNSVGGLVGNNYQGTISNCFAAGEVTGQNWNAGGLVGLNSGTVQYSYSVGKVSGFDTGGLIGQFNALPSAKVSFCFWDVITSGLSSSDGGTGKTTAEMMTKATYSGWDFVGEGANGTADVWRMCVDGVDYPKLTWQYAGQGDISCPDGVAIEDLEYFAVRWFAENCMWPDYCGGADMDKSGKVDLADFAIFAEHWLEGI